ncbi:hypothetical protein QEP16_21060 [Achromobacter insolitus]|jgi:hypothetical protein|uniref:Uncharacterized protein n=1 Tax=Achromobacter insolitus TaxID=217204 RepID=A0A6S7F9U2_9BURK|nr:MULTISPECIES: hypothetical protein [Achromobacter]GLK97793.1 membrane protein [Achromobacter xylosoxidans]APX73459.1 hypothetical protein BUW96_00020 [Achromobacter insolitus]APX76400.1 hypothetical protein BUW96_17095 [Achromobacter insolitus]AVG38180.1 hypothetical protein MC81_01640 [Achromobacter insolitus]MCP1404700.1 hypothetical protein [Achromobacter insolitus]
MDARSQQIRASGLSFSLLAGAFRFLGWLNGGAALLLTGFSLGVVGGDIAAPDLQLPLALLLGGLLVGCLGLLFAYLAQVSLLRQGYNGHLTRGHWPAQLLAMFCYLVSALAFCAACWLAAGQAVTDTPQTTTAYARR